MKFYQHIDFAPSMKVDENSDAHEKREAWLEEVACAILNHKKEDCCLKTIDILNTLVEADRIDLLPGKKGKFIPTNRLTGAAATKLRAVIAEPFTQIGQVAILWFSLRVPTAKFRTDRPYERETREVDFYYFLVNPDDLSELYKKGTLPKNIW